MTKLVIAFSTQNYTTLFHNEFGDPYILRTGSITCLILIIYSELHFQTPVRYIAPQCTFLGFVRTRTFSYLILDSLFMLHFTAVIPKTECAAHIWKCITSSKAMKA